MNKKLFTLLLALVTALLLAVTAVAADPVPEHNCMVPAHVYVKVDNANGDVWPNTNKYFFNKDTWPSPTAANPYVDIQVKLDTQPIRNILIDWYDYGMSLIEELPSGTFTAEQRKAQANSLPVYGDFYVTITGLKGVVLPTEYTANNQSMAGFSQDAKDVFNEVYRQWTPSLGQIVIKLTIDQSQPVSKMGAMYDAAKAGTFLQTLTFTMWDIEVPEFFAPQQIMGRLYGSTSFASGKDSTDKVYFYTWTKLASLNRSHKVVGEVTLVDQDGNPLSQADYDRVTVLLLRETKTEEGYNKQTFIQMTKCEGTRASDPSKAGEYTFPDEVEVGHFVLVFMYDDGVDDQKMLDNTNRYSGFLDNRLHNLIPFPEIITTRVVNVYATSDENIVVESVTMPYIQTFTHGDHFHHRMDESGTDSKGDTIHAQNDTDIKDVGSVNNGHSEAEHYRKELEEDIHNNPQDYPAFSRVEVDVDTYYAESKDFVNDATPSSVYETDLQTKQTEIADVIQDEVSGDIHARWFYDVTVDRSVAFYDENDNLITDEKATAKSLNKKALYETVTIQELVIEYENSEEWMPWFAGADGEYGTDDDAIVMVHRNHYPEGQDQGMVERFTRLQSHPTEEEYTNNSYYDGKFFMDIVGDALRLHIFTNKFSPYSVTFAVADEAWAPSQTGTGTVVRYTVTFNIDGNTDEVKAIRASGTVRAKDLPAPEKEGYTFDGWYTDSEMTKKVEGSIRVNKNMTLYGHWVSETLDDVNHYAYIIGYPDGTVRPDNNITREEVATIFYRLLRDEVRESLKTTTNDFDDVEAERWSNTAISTMANGGYIAGYPDGSFKPGNNITRAEFATMATRFAALVDVAETTFTDISGHWSESYVLKATKAGWIAGYPDNSFRPDAYITRAEAMTIINRVLSRSVNAEGLRADARIWSDIEVDDWFYYTVIEATNSHTFIRQEDGINETWTAIIENKTWD